MKNCIVAQSGGPTVAINASLSGVIRGALESDKIDKIYSRRRVVLGNFGGERGGKCRKSKIPSNYNKYKISSFL